MKKIILLTLIIIIIVALVITFWLRNQEQNPEQVTIEKPPIVDHFACSDYCPGAREQYIVKIYEGIEDDEECLKLGGRPSSYTGWGTFKICIAE